MLRLACPSVANVFAPPRLLPVTSGDKDAEILAVHHQFLVLQREPGGGRVRFTPGDRALLAALPGRGPAGLRPLRDGHPVRARLHVLAVDRARQPQN